MYELWLLLSLNIFFVVCQFSPPALFLLNKDPSFMYRNKAEGKEKGIRRIWILVNVVLTESSADFAGAIWGTFGTMNGWNFCFRNLPSFFSCLLLIVLLLLNYMSTCFDQRPLNSEHYWVSIFSHKMIYSYRTHTVWFHAVIHQLISQFKTN